MSEIIESLLVIAIMIYGMLVIIGGVMAGDPFEFASRPYRWMFRSMCKGIRAFCRRFPETAAVVALILIIAIAIIIAFA